MCLGRHTWDSLRTATAASGRGAQLGKAGGAGEEAGRAEGQASPY